MNWPTLRNHRVVVGVCGGIAAYKACEVVSRLRQSETQVRVVMTENALEFVGKATFRALSGQDVASEMFGEIPQMEIEHIALAEYGEAIVVVAATANVIAKVAAGICDDLLTTTLCAAAGKVIFAPAMNWRMWENPITARNVAILRDAGYMFVEPECGFLACGDVGTGRLAEVPDILDAVDQALGPQDSRLQGRSVVITAGPTREWLDPVRFISNPSSGKMGFALAAEALRRGAKVRLVTGPSAERVPWGCEVFPVVTTQEMLQAVETAVDGADVLIGAAAPADFQPAMQAEQKIKKIDGTLDVSLSATEDILATLSRSKGNRLHVGFAAETHDMEAHALSKLRRKGLDLIIANDVTAPGAGFSVDTNAVVIYDSAGRAQYVPQSSKREVAGAILDRIEALFD